MALTILLNRIEILKNLKTPLKKKKKREKREKKRKLQLFAITKKDIFQHIH